LHYQPKHDLLQHRIILVTGAGDGIGREAALTYARYGAKLVLLGRTESKLQEVEQQILQECGVHSYLIPCDMLTASHHDFIQIAGQIGQALPRLDVFCIMPVCWATSCRWKNNPPPSGIR